MAGRVGWLACWDVWQDGVGWLAWWDGGQGSLRAMDLWRKECSQVRREIDLV